MTRIEGVDLNNNKKIEISLTDIYGIGLTRSRKILSTIHIALNTKVKHLNDQQIISIRNILSNNYQLEGNLKRLENINIKRLIEIGSYRGKRHQLNLPSRGQRTKTNSRTSRKMKRITANKKNYKK
uniref:Ribosomal protein S13 n=1 Tax=Harveyella mirabilis TaxID=282355 RepID=A0A3S8UVX8_9FLOR|nr:ribosomal protein S13 [Harveyella mirabilis]